MIRLLFGTVTNIAGNTLILETAGGVGYLVSVTHHFDALPGEQVRIYTYLAVRETALDLYGFVTEDDLRLFELLLTISGVGPKSALQIMDQADRSLLIEAITLGDAVYLTKQSNITKKTAEKIILGLKDKINTICTLQATTPRIDTAYQDAFDTLVTLGYNPQVVRQTLETIDDQTTTSTLVAEALRRLS